MLDAKCAALLIALVAPQVFAAPNPTTSDDGGRIRTQLVAQNDIVISSQVEGKIAQLTLKEGDAFKRGQLLVGFDCELYTAQLRKAEAGAEAASKVYAVNKRLSELRSVGELDVEQAKAKAKETEAEASYVRAVVDRCQITAPFAGRVAKRLASQSEYVAAGKPLLQIVDAENLELKLNVPSSWLIWLRINSALQVHIEDINKEYAGIVVRLGAKIDPVSQTVEVNARIKGVNPELLPGMSGWVTFPSKR